MSPEQARQVTMAVLHMMQLAQFCFGFWLVKQFLPISED